MVFIEMRVTGEAATDGLPGAKGPEVGCLAGESDGSLLGFRNWAQAHPLSGAILSQSTCKSETRATTEPIPSQP